MKIINDNNATHAGGGILSQEIDNLKSESLNHLTSSSLLTDYIAVNITGGESSPGEIECMLNDNPFNYKFLICTIQDKHADDTYYGTTNIIVPHLATAPSYGARCYIFGASHVLQPGSVWFKCIEGENKLHIRVRGTAVYTLTFKINIIGIK